MKRLGLLGGMSWESTASYYGMINREVARRLGGLHSADLVLHSVDFAPLAAMQQAGDWDAIGQYLAAAARSLVAQGASAIVLCTNTMHKVAPQIEAAIDVPLLHIVEPTGRALAAAGVERVGLLGTRFTLTGDFYIGKLERDHGVEVLVPDADAIDVVNTIIFEELCVGITRSSSRAYFIDTVAELERRGADAVILGCTEIGLLVSSSDLPVPAFDTTRLHAESAVQFALT